jgi:hypothetical protein
VNPLSKTIGVLRHIPFGYRVARAYLANLTKVWNYDSLPARGSQLSSISDTNEYSKLLRAAAEDSATFSRFRSNSAYLKILDHVTYRQALQYRALVDLEDFPQITTEFIGKFSKIGGPLTFPFRDLHGEVSTTFFRYLKVTRDLYGLFELGAAPVISEIGVGYGGQVALINQVFPSATFELYDLPEVHAVTAKFLHEIGVNTGVHYVDGRDPVPVASDLVISNYAFSELAAEVQEQYLTNVILRASSGYLTWNLLSERNLGGMGLSEFLNRVPDSVAFEENPNTYRGNKVVVWGHRRGTSPL